jgi:hypothetical protein
MSNVNIKVKGIVGLGGYATSGKDLMCRLIRERGGKVKRFALADKLKETLDPFVKEQYGTSLFNCSREEKELLRPLMVAYSKLHRHRTGGAYFFNKIADEIIDYSKEGLAIITDLRYAEYEGTDEAWRVKEVGGSIVCLNKYKIESHRKVFVKPPNQEEAENGPKIQEMADYNIEWPHSNNGLGYLDRYVDNLIIYLNEALKE